MLWARKSMLRETMDTHSLSERSWTDLIDRVSYELRLTRVAWAHREYRFNLLKIEFAGCSVSLVSATFTFHDWEKIESQRRHTARYNVRVTHRKHNVFFMIVHFSIITSSPRPRSSSSGKTGSRNYTYLFRKTRRASRKREEGGEKEGDCGSPSSIPRRSLPSRF